MKRRRSILVGVVAWFALAIAALAQGWIWPRTPVAWVVTLVLGPAIFVLVELVGELVAKGVIGLPGVGRLARWLKVGGKLTGLRAVVALALILGVTLLILLVGLRFRPGGAPSTRQWLCTNFVVGA